MNLARLVSLDTQKRSLDLRACMQLPATVLSRSDREIQSAKEALFFFFQKCHRDVNLVNHFLQLRRERKSLKFDQLEVETFDRVSFPEGCSFVNLQREIYYFR